MNETLPSAKHWWGETLPSSAREADLHPFRRHPIHEGTIGHSHVSTTMTIRTCAHLGQAERGVIWIHF